MGTGDRGTWIHCHGIPGSRGELSHLYRDPGLAGLRLIIPDRPGYGDSSPHPDYGFAQHTADVSRLANHLGLDRFCLSGFSGGGVFALATALALDQRVTQLAIAATPAGPLMNNPFPHASDLTANAWRAAIANSAALARDLQPLAASADGLFQAFLEGAGPSEARYLSSDLLRPLFLGNFRKVLTQGAVIAAAAIARDTGLIANRWPFLPERLDTPVRVIHGQGDRLVHQAHQRALLAHLPDAESDLIADAGHYAVLGNLWPEGR